MLCGIFGDEFAYNMGNLKTYTMTYCLYMDYQAGATIYANYYLNFPFKQLKNFEMLVEALDDLYDVSVGLDELHVLFDAYSGVSKETGTWYLKEFVRQTRKRRVKVYITAQNFMDIHKSIRKMLHHVWVSKKLHADFSTCENDMCHETHIQEISNYKNHEVRYFEVNPQIFKLYDSDELIPFEETNEKHINKNTTYKATKEMKK